MNKNYWIAIGVLAVVLLGIFISYSSYQSAQTALAPGALDSFVQCIKDKGITFYGAFWCPHCQRTKAEFGDSASKLPYVECSTPDGQGQTQVCIDKGIQQYPTWMFPDGTTLTGEHTLQELSDAFQCPLPAGVGTSSIAIPIEQASSSPAT